MKMCYELMLIYFLVALTCLPAFSQAAPPNGEKVFTQEDLRKAVNKEVEEKFKKLENQGAVDFARELLKKENDLNIKEFELFKQGEVLNNNKMDFEKKLVEFKQRQEQLINCLDENEKDSKSRLFHMVEVIGKMRPANAAAMLAVQDPVLSVQLLGMLDSAQVSKIFNQMDKTISAKLQKMYLEMKK